MKAIFNLQDQGEVLSPGQSLCHMLALIVLIRGREVVSSTRLLVSTLGDHS